MNRLSCTLPPSLAPFKRELEERAKRGPMIIKDPITSRALKKQDQEKRKEK